MGRRHFCHLITLEGNFPRPACCVPCVLNSVTVLTKRKKVIESVKMSNKHLMISPPSNNNLDNCKMDSGAPGASDPSHLVSQGLDPNQTLRLRFRVKSGLSCVAVVSNEDNNNGWDAILRQGRLYIHVGPSQMTDGGSKEAF